MSFRLLDERDINAIKGKLQGSAVRADDVLPAEHTAKVKVGSKNLIVFPYGEGTFTRDGIEWRIDETDNCVIANGTPTQNTSFNIAFRYHKTIPLKKGKTYTLSCVSTFTNATGYVYLQNVANGVTVDSVTVRNDSKTFTATVDGYANIGIVLMNGITYENEKFVIQLEEGDTVTEYTPYVDPASVTVTRCGKNLINHNLMKSQSDLNGVTITRNEDTITFDGTLTLDSVLYNTAFCMCGGLDNEYVLSYKRISGTVTDTASLCIGDSNSPDESRQSWGNLKLKSEDNAYTLKSIKPYIKDMWIYATKGTVFSNFTIKVQLEKGNSQTEYETYTGESHTPSADGSCDIKTISPTMTLLTDNAGVTIECEYNKDATAVIEKLTNAIIALGGTV